MSDLSQHERSSALQTNRWGGVAGIAGGILLIASAAVVGALGLPDASDVETLTDFEHIESGRIAEHFLYLGALILFACTFSSSTDCSRQLIKPRLFSARPWPRSVSSSWPPVRYCTFRHRRWQTCTPHELSP